MVCRCKFQVGDQVDWHRFSWRLRRPAKSQIAFWHGIVLRDLGIQTLGSERGHVLEVEWTKSNWWGKLFTKEPEGGAHIAHRPVHTQLEMCLELQPCRGLGSRLHPTRLN